MLCI